jgi:beta-glucosidase
VADSNHYERRGVEMAKIYATKNPEISEREIRNMNRSRKIASQGMVLLSNDGALPIKEETKKIALYGNGGRHTIKGGTGSGDVNSRSIVNVEEGLKEAGFTITTTAWLDRYDQVVESAKDAYFSNIREQIAAGNPEGMMMLFNDPFKDPEINPVEDSDIEASDTDTAVYVISRNSGEGRDRYTKAGDYELYEEEKRAIAKLASSYAKLIVVLNVGGVIDTKFIRQCEGVNAILYMSQAGNIGGYALADVLTGKVTPSGHLTTTWAENYLDYPGAADFSHVNGDDNDEYYKEGVFVGYRYFDTFNVAPAYPFGYGLSYTDFAIETQDVKACGKKVVVTVKVTNIGEKYSGKEVVQIYYSAPDGQIEKPYQELAAYAKTGELAPGESEVLTISYPTAVMASYDIDKASYILEAGTYYVRVGNGSRSTKVAAAITLDETAVTEVLANKLPLDDEMEDLSSKGVTPYSYESEAAEKEAAIRLSISAADVPCVKAVYQKENPEIPANTSETKIKLTDVMAGKATMDELVGQLTVAEMAELCVGTSRGAFGDEPVIGSASAAVPGAAGDTSSLLINDRDVRNMILADGPAGLRLSPVFHADADNNILPGASMAIADADKIYGEQEAPQLPADAQTYYQYCTAIPIATLLAQTWDPSVIQDAGDIVGEEMEELGATIWLAPGMNIHRNPLCGRNFEYYSEDPLVAGMCAAADTLGVQKHPGVGTCIKHFAFNNQEDNRMHTNAHVGERAAREIYLKGFEIAVKASQPISIMTSYNLINGVHAANNYDTLTAIARNEWGFAGMVMTDWGTTGGIEMEPGRVFKYGCSSSAGCIKAGNDLTMPGNQKDVDDIIEAVGAAEGTVPYPLTLGDLQACAKRILSIVAQCSAYEGAVPYAAEKLGIEGYIKVEK